MQAVKISLQTKNVAPQNWADHLNGGLQDRRSDQYRQISGLRHGKPTNKLSCADNYEFPFEHQHAISTATITTVTNVCIPKTGTSLSVQKWYAARTHDTDGSKYCGSNTLRFGFKHRYSTSRAHPRTELNTLILVMDMDFYNITCHCWKRTGKTMGCRYELLVF